MSKETKEQLLARLRRRYATAGPIFKSKLLDQAIELLGITASGHSRLANYSGQASWPPSGPWAGPRFIKPDKLLPVLKAIWFAALKPCGRRLHAFLPKWLPTYEVDHRQVDKDVRRSLLSASPRIAAHRRGGTRTGSLLRQSIPVRGTWTEEGPGWLEVDTVALCGGLLGDLHLWMFDAVDTSATTTPQ